MFVHSWIHLNESQIRNAWGKDLSPNDPEFGNHCKENRKSPQYSKHGKAEKLFAEKHVSTKMPNEK